MFYTDEIPMSSVSVCIPIYNNVRNCKNLIDSIRAQSCLRLQEHEIIVYNDGSTLAGVDEEAKTFCSANNIRYFSSDINKGVAWSWNALCGASNSEIIVMLNDDLRCGSEDWIKPLLFLFSKNDRLGIVYWCQRLVDPSTGLPQRLTPDSARLLARRPQQPVLRHNFCGAFFAFRKSIWQSVQQPDGSIGFWNDLISYGEEFDLSAEALAREYFILQLPFVWDHLHSQTFKSNPDKKLRKTLSPYLTLEEFRGFMHGQASSGQAGQSALRRMGRFVRGTQTGQTTISTLDYSMAMLNKKWTGRTILGIDGPQFLRQMRLDGSPLALRHGTNIGEFSPPQTVVVYGQGNTEEACVPWDSLMDDNPESLA